MATMVLVHGGWGGGFAWDEVVPHLTSLGHRTAVIDRLPSVGDDPADLGDLHDDAAHVRSVLDDVGDDAVLVGHSYSGMVITEVADHPAIRHLVYLAAFWPPRGASLVDLLGGELPPDAPFVVREDGAAEMVDDLDRVRQALAQDVDEATLAPYVDRLGLQSVASYTAPSSAPEHDHPTTYVVCEQDRAIPPEAQEAMAQSADRVERLDSSHCPMWSMPDRVAALLDAAASA